MCTREAVFHGHDVVWDEFTQRSYEGTIDDIPLHGVFSFGVQAQLKTGQDSYKEL